MKRPRHSIRVLCAAAFFAAPALVRAGEPSNDEQLMLEMTNRMRWDPAAELHVLTNINLGPPATWGEPWSDDPQVDGAMQFFDVDADTLASQWAQLPSRVAPLAWNSNLHNAAAGHNEKIIEFDQQSHQLPGEPGLGQRYLNAGYTYTTGAENVYAYSDSIFYGHAGFAIDWGPGPGGIQSPAGHRDNMMNGAMREIGIAITPEGDPETQVGPLVITQDFGRRSGNAFVTGVVYEDANPDYFYTPSEGLGGVDVKAFTAGTTTLRGSTTTFGSGGYTLQMAPGTYDVTLSGGGLGTRTITYRNVLVGSDNVKIDNFSSFIAGTGGAWGSVNNWSAGVPNGPGTMAVLGRTIPGQAPGPRQINVNAPVSVGHLVFDGANPVTIGGAARLTIDAGSGEPATMTVLEAPGGAPHTISAPLAIAGAVTRGGTGSLEITGPQDHQPGALLLLAEGHTRLTTNAGSPSARNLGVILAGDTLSFGASQDLVRLDVLGGGRATIEVAPGPRRIVAMNGFSVSGGTLDLTDNAALIDYDGGGEDSTPADVRNAITEAYARGAWTGPGITSSTAAGEANTAVGYANSGDIHDFRLDQVYTFFDRVIDETTMLVRYTLEGDTDLDGAVTFGDFLQMREHLAGAGEWSDGDFDYDGRVTAKDYAMLRRNIGASLDGVPVGISAAEWATLDAFAAVVPEPGPATLLLLAGTGILRRRRRAVK